MLSTRLNLYLLLLFYFIPTSYSITFDSSKLKDVNQTNYLKFQYPINDFGLTFETMSADFNGDGFDDILSLGGVTDNMGTGGVVFATPLSLMLYTDGEFIHKDIDVINHFPRVNIIDIDNDGDLDIVTSYSHIFINDSNANFTPLEYNSNWTTGNYLSTLDWDNDGDLDIVTQKKIFINDGNLNFNQIYDSPDVINSTYEPFEFYDLDDDGDFDILKESDLKLQSWIKNSQGEYILQSELELPMPLSAIQNIYSANDKQVFLITLRSYPNNTIWLIENDGNGVFTHLEFPLNMENIGHTSLDIQKIYNQDMNNDGIKEIVVATIFKNTTDCSNGQNLVFIYETINGEWQLKDRLHSEGYANNPNFGFSSGSLTLPSLIDLNQDNLTDIVLNSEKPIVWLNYNITGTSLNQYGISNSSLMQFTTAIDVVDFETHEIDADGKLDIFNAVEIIPQCQQPEIIYTPKNFEHSLMWINTNDNWFTAFYSGFGGGNDFLQPYHYMLFADLKNQGTSSMLVTQYEDYLSAYKSYYFDPTQFEPMLRIQLPETIKYAQTANLDLTGNQKEVVLISASDEAPIVILALTNNNFVEIARFDFGNINGEFKLADIDGDGDIDIIANNKGNNGITIWYNQGQRNFAKGQSFGVNPQAIAILDINSDGKLDIMTSNDTHDIWVQTDNNQFIKIDYDDSFWHAPAGKLEDFQNWIPTKLQVKDINNDGKEDLIAYSSSAYRVYLNESTENKIWFYYVYSSYAGQDVNKKEVILYDQNNDDLLDFIHFNGSSIVFNTQSDVDVLTGLFYDPDFNGHGYSIEEIGRNNLFYTLFFSYDDSGKPQWFSSLNRHTKSSNGYESLHPANVQNAIRFLYDYTNNQALADNSIENSGSLSFSENSFTNYLARAFYKIGETYDSWAIRPIIQAENRPVNDLSGLWWAGNNDSGWGISLSFVQREGREDVVAILYFYDELGEPRWLIGNQSNFIIGENINIEMKQLNGYGRQQNYVELTEIPAGTLTLNLEQASNAFGQAGTLSMDVIYPGDLMGSHYWQRNNIPIALFSKPNK